MTLPVPGPGETLRQALSAATSAPACAGCHSLVNPLGFAFSHYDAAGEYQETENGLPIDASGTHNGNSFSWEFDGLGELNSLLAYSEEVTHCVPRRLLGNAIEEVRGDGFESPNFSAEADYVVCEVVNSYRSARKMVRAIASSPSILGQ